MLALVFVVVLIFLFGLSARMGLRIVFPPEYGLIYPPRSVGVVNAAQDHRYAIGRNFYRTHPFRCASSAGVKRVRMNISLAKNVLHPDYFHVSFYAVATKNMRDSRLCISDVCKSDKGTQFFRVSEKFPSTDNASYPNSWPVSRVEFVAGQIDGGQGRAGGFTAITGDSLLIFFSAADSPHEIGKLSPDYPSG